MNFRKNYKRISSLYAISSEGFQICNRKSKQPSNKKLSEKIRNKSSVEIYLLVCKVNQYFPRTVIPSCLKSLSMHKHEHEYEPYHKSRIRQRLVLLGLVTMSFFCCDERDLILLNNESSILLSG